jgi:hypothetical protein
MAITCTSTAYAKPCNKRQSTPGLSAAAAESFEVHLMPLAANACWQIPTPRQRNAGQTREPLPTPVRVQRETPRNTTVGHALIQHLILTIPFNDHHSFQVQQHGIITVSLHPTCMYAGHDMTTAV